MTQGVGGGGRGGPFKRDWLLRRGSALQFSTAGRSACFIHTSCFHSQLIRAQSPSDSREEPRGAVKHQWQVEASQHKGKIGYQTKTFQKSLRGDEELLNDRRKSGLLYSHNFHTFIGYQSRISAMGINCIHSSQSNKTKQTKARKESLKEQSKNMAIFMHLCKQ